jgi:hypothetical protein
MRLLCLAYITIGNFLANPNYETTVRGFTFSLPR